MTRTKTTKLVAIIMAVFMAFAFMSFSLISVSADPAPATQSEENGGTPKTDEETPDAEGETDDSDGSTPNKEEDKTPNPTPATTKVIIPDIAIPTYDYGAPDINVIINFEKETPKQNYNNLDKTLLELIGRNIKVYSKKVDDNTYTNEVNFTIATKFNNIRFNNNTLTFVVPLSKATGFNSNTTYYLSLGKELNELIDAEGQDTFFPFTTKTITTTAKPVNTTKRTVYTVRTTNRTIKAKSANTDDPSHLPVWIGLVAVSALMLGAVYFVKERD